MGFMDKMKEAADKASSQINQTMGSPAGAGGQLKTSQAQLDTELKNLGAAAFDLAQSGQLASPALDQHVAAVGAAYQAVQTAQAQMAAATQRPPVPQAGVPGAAPMTAPPAPGYAPAPAAPAPGYAPAAPMPVAPPMAPAPAMPGVAPVAPEPMAAPAAPVAPPMAAPMAAPPMPEAAPAMPEAAPPAPMAAPPVAPPPFMPPDPTGGTQQ